MPLLDLNLLPHQPEEFSHGARKFVLPRCTHGIAVRVPLRQQSVSRKDMDGAGELVGAQRNDEINSSQSRSNQQDAFFV